MNQVVLVGRLTENPVVVDRDNKKVTSINLAVTRSFKNVDGVYETDFIRCILWNAIAESTAEYCHVGDVVGIRGRLQTSNYDDENGKRHFVTDVIAERVSFLSSGKFEKDEENEETSSEEKSKEKTKTTKKVSKKN